MRRAPAVARDRRSTWSLSLNFGKSSNSHFTTGTIEDTADLDINDNELEDQFYESSSLNDSFDVDSQFDENLCIPGLWSRVRQLKRGLASTSCRTNIE